MPLKEEGTVITTDATIANDIREAIKDLNDLLKVAKDRKLDIEIICEQLTFNTCKVILKSITKKL